VKPFALVLKKLEAIINDVLSASKPDALARISDNQGVSESQLKEDLHGCLQVLTEDDIWMKFEPILRSTFKRNSGKSEEKSIKLRTEGNQAMKTGNFAEAWKR